MLKSKYQEENLEINLAIFFCEVTPKISRFISQEKSSVWEKNVVKVGFHDKNPRISWYWILYQATERSASWKNTNNTLCFEALRSV